MPKNCTFKLALLFVFVNVISGFISFASAQTLSSNAKLSILTCDSGSELYSIYGHTALRVKDASLNLDIVYNFGYFDFRTENFYLKFVKGDLQYFAGTDSFENFMAEYVYFQRGVYEQILNLNQRQKQAIYDELNAIISSDKRFYTYKFIDRNCTTMIADILNKNLTEKINTSIKDSNKTNRKILYDCIIPFFYANLGINIMFGVKTDAKFNHIYLPLQLLEGISLSKNDGQKLSNQTVILNKQSYLTNEQSFFSSKFWYFLFFIGFIVFNKQLIRNCYFILMGVLGVFLIWVGWYSDHSELQPNINILLFNPLYLLLLYFVSVKSIKHILITIYILAICLFIYTLLMLNKVHFLMFSIMILTNIILLLRQYKNIKKVQKKDYSAL